ncbi:MAG: hypothetical protein KKB57_13085 [Proteobacteria bacterium]|nr:hypothetical protein [Pseudomonadota bacterium]
MGVTYDDVMQFHKQILNKAKSEIDLIEKIIVQGRDEQNVPIYITKCRIKSPDSIFLKTKRKTIENLPLLHDLAGVRVLCLFEQDLFPTHKYILKSLSDADYKLLNFKLFNWPDDGEQQALIEDVRGFTKRKKFDNTKKDSGYKSIHYIYEKKNSKPGFYLEIQLRTLLQDVWGELEHSLSYKKGNIHPHIKKSFALLARDLETNDLLISHLRNISDREKEGQAFAIKKAGPKGYFGYEEDIVPNKFKEGSSKKLFDEYIDSMKLSTSSESQNDQSETDPELKKKKLKKAEGLYQKLIAGITIPQEDNDPKLHYFIGMEKAYHNFCNGNYKDSFDIYTQMISNNKDFYTERYVIYFRMGEIHFINGEIEKALAAFDQSSILLKNHAHPHYNNQLAISNKLAYIYWLLGDEYIQFSINLINEAETIYKKRKTREAFSRTDYLNIKNSKCAYYLYNYIIKNEEILWPKFTASTKNRKHKERIEAVELALNQALSALNDLEPLLKDKKASANMYDTVAWFYFNLYLKDRKQDDLDKAKKYCRELWDKPNRATLQMTSISLHKSHTQEILNTK